MKIFLLLLGIPFFVAGMLALFFIPAAWIQTPEANAPVIRVTIPSGTQPREVANILVERRILSSPIGYRFFIRIDDIAKKPRAGTYELTFGMNYKQIARAIALGPARDETDVTVIEGWTIADISKELGKQGVTSTQGAFSADEYREDYPILSDIPKNETLEGYLYPNTYRVWKDQLPQSLIKKQLAEFANRTEGYLAEAEKQGRSFHDVIILASIVEKEARHDEDRAIIAGIFMNRLKNGMRLQSDATLNYVTKSGRPRLTAEDLANESLYNTYQHDGLPPGPISNPGIESLEAALHPAKTDYYFFLSDAQGKTYFARNLEEHTQNRFKAYGE